jgi:kynurenine formamidase
MFDAVRRLVRRRMPRRMTAGVGRQERLLQRIRWKRVGAANFLVLTLITLVAAPSAGPQTDPFLPGKSPWGPDDQAGNSNTQTPEKVLQATKLIKNGKKYRLGHDYYPEMPKFPGNSWAMEMRPPTQVLRQVFNQEYIHGDIAQNGTQFDGLGHFGIQSQGSVNPQDTQYYNGFTGSQVHGVDGLRLLGVQNMKPFFTRGILIDVARYLNNNNVLDEGQEITMKMVRDTLKAQGMTEADIQVGDVVLFRTGWEENWDNLDVYYRGAPGMGGAVPGIGLEVAKWLASKQVACVGADNWGVSVAPHPQVGSPDPPPSDILEPVHNELIVKNGIPHQESMALSALADDAAFEKNVNGNGRAAYTFAYIFVPVPIRGASGSPGIPLAVK